MVDVSLVNLPMKMGINLVNPINPVNPVNPINLINPWLTPSQT